MTILYRVFLSSLCLIVTIPFWWNAVVVTRLEGNIADIFQTGLNDIHQNHYQQALASFNQVIERQGDLVASAYSNRCLVNLRLQNYAAAKTDCIAAIDHNADNLEAYLNLGLAYDRQGEFLKAIAEYQQMLQRNEEDYRAYYNRGLAYLALNNYQLAIADYQTALLLAPNFRPESQSLIYNDLALAYMMLADFEPAIFNFSQAIAVNENNYEAYYNRGCAHHQEGRYQAAIEDFAQVVKLNPDFTQVYVNRAVLQHQIGQREAALSDLNMALQQYKSQGSLQQYNLVVNLKQRLFSSQPSQLV